MISVKVVWSVHLWKRTRYFALISMFRCARCTCNKLFDIKVKLVCPFIYLNDERVQCSHTKHVISLQTQPYQLGSRWRINLCSNSHFSSRNFEQSCFDFGDQRHCTLITSEFFSFPNQNHFAEFRPKWLSLNSKLNNFWQKSRPTMSLCHLLFVDIIKEQKSHIFDDWIMNIFIYLCAQKLHWRVKCVCETWSTIDKIK